MTEWVDVEVLGVVGELRFVRESDGCGIVWMSEYSNC